MSYDGKYVLWDARSYMEALPLERVIEIHVCGTSRKEGQLIDSHEALKDEDYVLLEWLLRHTAPKAITLEYSRDPAQVPDQIARLNQIISQANTES